MWGAILEWDMSSFAVGYFPSIMPHMFKILTQSTPRALEMGRETILRNATVVCARDFYPAPLFSPVRHFASF